jgi:hypothetical protein
MAKIGVNLKKCSGERESELSRLIISFENQVNQIKIHRKSTFVVSNMMIIAAPKRRPRGGLFTKNKKSMPAVPKERP